MSKKNLKEEWTKRVRSIFTEVENLDLDTFGGDTDVPADDTGLVPDEPVSDELDAGDDEMVPETITLTKDLLTQLLNKAAGKEDEVSDDDVETDDVEDMDVEDMEDSEVDTDDTETVDEMKHDDKKDDYMEDDNEGADAVEFANTPEEGEEEADYDDAEDDTAEDDGEDNDDDLDVDALVNKAVELSTGGQTLDVDSFELLVAADDDTEMPDLDMDVEGGDEVNDDMETTDDLEDM